MTATTILNIRARLEPSADRSSFIEDKTLAFPQAFFGRNGFKILQDPALQMIYLVKPKGFHISRGFFAADSASTKHGHLARAGFRSEEHTSELQSRENLVCRLLLEKKKKET